MHSGDVGDRPVTGPGCEPVTDGLLAEPVSAVSSLAFVVAALVVLALARDRTTGRPGPLLTVYAVLVAAIGLGSLVQHGPDPAWSDVAHDLPLLATLVLVAADAAADLTPLRSRPGPTTWWTWWVAAPSAALLVVVVAAPRAGDLAQGGVALVAVALTLARVRATPAQAHVHTDVADHPHADPRLRRRAVTAVAVLALGAVIGSLSREGGPLCVPDSPWQGHAAWHVLASVALVVLAPVVGSRSSRPDDRR